MRRWGGAHIARLLCPPSDKNLLHQIIIYRCSVKGRAVLGQHVVQSLQGEMSCCLPSMCGGMYVRVYTISSTWLVFGIHMQARRQFRQVPVILHEISGWWQLRRRRRRSLLRCLSKTASRRSIVATRQLHRTCIISKKDLEFFN